MSELFGFPIKKAKEVNTAPLIATGLIGGWITARETGVRPLGGIALAAAGVWSARSWYSKGGAPLTASLLGAYLGAFGLCHPLAKKIGSWPSVLLSTAGATAAAAVFSDAK